MIQPAPTSRIDPELARGVFEGVVEPTGNRPRLIRVSFPNTSYELHLVPAGSITTPVGKRVIGTIGASAMRIDVVQTGGRFVEPVYGRPRRVQGTVIGTRGTALVVEATMPIHIEPTDRRQKATDFKPGDLVAFDVLDGATFVSKG